MTNFILGFILGAGMMSGATSPARPWFRLATPDEDLMEYGPVKEWLADAQRIQLHVFARSNTYPMLHQLYEELFVFGTHAAITMDDFDKVIHHYNSPTGEYALASDYRGNVNTIYREFEKTVGEIVGEFGYDNCSQTVRRLYDAGTLDAWVPLLHIIEPRTDREPGNRTAANKAWKSCYREIGRENGDEMYLRESGFDTFPGLCPRWSRSGGDIYGGSPAMDCLGDGRQLQHEQLRKGNAIDSRPSRPCNCRSQPRAKTAHTCRAGSRTLTRQGRATPRGPCSTSTSTWNTCAKISWTCANASATACTRICSSCWRTPTSRR